jgi:predicted HicB family RNase H-like nuclease
MATGQIASTVRIPEKTHEAARIAAARKRLSLNAYVIRALEAATQAESKQTRKKPA